jgi:hypothetical protein
MRGPAAHIPTLRALYREKWGREWPHDDEYLRELTHEGNFRFRCRAPGYFATVGA